MRASRSDLRLLQSDGSIDPSEVMKQAHTLAGVNAEFGRKSYAEYLSDALERKWNDARKSERLVRQAGGVEAVRARLLAEERKIRGYSIAGQILKYGTKKRQLVLDKHKEAAAERLPVHAEVEGYGKSWTADGDTPMHHGSQWLPHVGEKIRYMYYREMDDDALERLNEDL